MGPVLRTKFYRIALFYLCMLLGKNEAKSRLSFPFKTVRNHFAKRLINHSISRLEQRQ